LPAIWREAATESYDTVHQADRIARVYDDCVADREQAHSYKFCIRHKFWQRHKSHVGAWIARDLARSGSRIV